MTWQNVPLLESIKVCSQLAQEYCFVLYMGLSTGTFTLCNFSKRDVCDFLLGTMDTGIFNSTIYSVRFPAIFPLEKWVLYLFVKTFPQREKMATEKKNALAGKIDQCERALPNLCIALLDV